jgi:hypothetical protein
MEIHTYQGGVPIPNRAPRGEPDLIETLQGVPLAINPQAPEWWMSRRKPWLPASIDSRSA